MLQLGYLVGSLPSCWCNSLQRRCFPCFGLVQGRDVWGLVVEEERFVAEQDHAEEDAEEQEYAKKNVK